jgi:hypothetical protein
MKLLKIILWEIISIKKMIRMKNKKDIEKRQVQSHLEA